MLAFLLLVNTVLAQNNSIIVGSMDTQFDLSHPGLHQKAWVNTLEIPGDNIDNDNNGYVDDINGWNFSDKNNVLFDFNPKFSKDNTEYAEYAMRRRAGVATEAELAWLKLKDDNIGKEHRPYITYLHGTSSAYVNLKNTKNAKFISLRGASQAEILGAEKAPSKPIPQNGQELTDVELETMVKDYVEEIHSKFEEPILYAAAHGARVIQFGYLWQLSDNEAEDFQQMAYDKYGKILSKERAQKAARDFFERLIKRSDKLLSSHPQILFMFAAGNSTSDLDQTLAYPHFSKGENKIIVGASIFRDKIAPFSSYGKTTVDALIPTVNYYVAVPSAGYMLSSATSVSVVITTNLAVLILEENPNLTALEVKKIMLSTVIQKDFLKEKVKTSGIIYSERALEAARNSNFMSVDEAIQRSFETVQD